MFGGEVIFRSVSTALSVIYTAKKYMVRGLDTLALMYISKNINIGNVLLVLQTILVFYNTEHSPHHAGQYTKVQEAIQKIMEYEPRHIVRHCFHLIDKTAKKVLESDEIEDISLDLLKSIIRRDSLCVPSELSVWQALHRWSHRQCRRRHISPSIGNKIEVLEGAQYSVRYLTMTSKQFMVASSLLAKEEEESILYNLLHMDSSLIKSILGVSTIHEHIKK